MGSKVDGEEIVLGIDPGLATTGYGVIRNLGRREQNRYVECGVLTTDPERRTPQRLHTLFQEIQELVAEFNPDALAIERVFFSKNAKTAMEVSEARGVVLLAAGTEEIPVYEYTPLQIKRIITGYGKANKRQVQEMVKRLLDLNDIPKPADAADAVGVALCYILDQHSGLRVEPQADPNKNRNRYHTPRHDL
ncbi:MAG: crossover junction endodeoxyribonuclease RuvC [Candidatus Bipolaricaulia bacterium]